MNNSSVSSVDKSSLSDFGSVIAGNFDFRLGGGPGGGGGGGMFLRSSGLMGCCFTFGND